MPGSKVCLFLKSHNLFEQRVLMFRHGKASFLEEEADIELSRVLSAQLESTGDVFKHHL